jgi:4-alpha-glucanotransferase
MNRLTKRRAGVLLHPTSLPSEGEGGTLGKKAYQFVDFLAASGFSVWQTLPLGQPHGDKSPYQCQSIHAGNILLINLEILINQGCLNRDAYEERQPHELWEHYHRRILRCAFRQFRKQAPEEIQLAYGEFLQANAYWLNDYALFRALKAAHNHRAWWEWGEKYQHRDPAALAVAKQRYVHEIAQTSFEQFIFFRQWKALKQYANSQGVLLFGDMPIFVAADSVDVWIGRENFAVDERGQPNVVAGVPPDYFSETGQRWGNPHYNWAYMQANGFEWWKARLRGHQALFDILRIDHFRGFEAYWEIPVHSPNAIQGRWIKAPGEALFDALHSTNNPLQLVAEDLGIITKEVNMLRKKYQIPGMKILQFAFEGGASNPYLPHHHVKNSVIYTGTHDNDTTLGWFKSLSPEQRVHVCNYLNCHEDDMPWALNRAALSSVSRLAILPMQDLLAKDSDARMNVPGVTDGNWGWHFQWSEIPDNLSTYLRHLNELYGRI